MRRRNAFDNSTGCPAWVILLGIASVTCVVVYALSSPFFSDPHVYKPRSVSTASNKSWAEKARCCRGLEKVELWGRVVEWGDSHYTNSSYDCCRACRARCKDDAPCECNSWVYCGDERKCGNKLGQCWLKSQDDPLYPDIQATGNLVMWTSGLIFGKDTGIFGIETSHGTIRIKLLVDCAPRSVSYFIDLLKLRHCAGCHIYRAESRGSSWDIEGNQIAKSTSSPYGLVQGTLSVDSLNFKELPMESCPIVQRGNVGWIEGGPEFFISLANHEEWYPKHTVFAQVLPEDMLIVEKLTTLPTQSSTWSGVKVALLEETVPIKIVKADNSLVTGASSD